MKNNRIAKSNALSASFRDPSGYVFTGDDGLVYRQVNKIATKDFEAFIKSKLYLQLSRDKLIVSHQEISDAPLLGEAYKIIKPQQINFISYPFEWSFSQLKDAALLTLKIQKLALAKNLSLKDASAYNIQFVDGQPIFIDTLSFEKYTTNKPWDAYRQFCQHFLTPLALMCYRDLSLGQLSRVFIDGIPLDLAAKLLPPRAKVKPSIIMHILLHAKAQSNKASSAAKPDAKLSKHNQLAIIDNLATAIKKLKLPKVKSEWGEYYDNTNYSESAAAKKDELIIDFLKPLNVKTAIDLGGNNGRFSRSLNKRNIFTVCADIDPNAVEDNYRQVKANKETMMLPMLIDLTNPGGALGWANQERSVFAGRIKADVLLVLALIHHLAISNNLPFTQIAQYLQSFAPYLVIEFVPKQDSQVQKLLATRKDIFDTYDAANFKKAFGIYYNLIKEQPIDGSVRTLFLFERK